jgi:hypothetical protein
VVRDAGKVTLWLVKVHRNSLLVRSTRETKIALHYEVEKTSVRSIPTVLPGPQGRKLESKNIEVLQWNFGIIQSTMFFC